MARSARPLRTAGARLSTSPCPREEREPMSAASLLELMHVIQLGVGSVLIYHALLVRRLSRMHQAVPFTGMIGMSLAAAAYYLLLDSFRLVHGQFAIRAIMHLVWIAGTL